MLMSIGGLCPVPSDALVTPVTFQVRRRKLRGILEEFDETETGKRELSGEWVVGKKTWRRLQAEWRARKQGKPTTTAPGSGKRKERVILYLHGGMYPNVPAFVELKFGAYRRILYVQCRYPSSHNYTPCKVS